MLSDTAEMQITLHPSELLLEESYDLHNKFNEEVWKNKESFHNKEHIRAVAAASDKLLDAAQFGEDPLRVEADLERWNNDNPGFEIKNIYELKKVFRIAIADHDKGNIAKEMTVHDGTIEAEFWDTYTAGKGGTDETAEDRSIRFAKMTIQNETGLTEDEKRRFEPLVIHLIDQTRFMPRSGEEDLPFARTIRVLDQIGNDMFSQNNDRVIGLLRENLGENKNAVFNPSYYYNFVIRRINDLVPDKKDQEMLFSIWGKPMPMERQNMPDVDIKVSDYLDAIDMIRSGNEGITAQVEREFKEKTGVSISEMLKLPLP